MIYGYARVSTSGQARDGNSLESQERTLREKGVERLYLESYTGTKKSRPKLDELLNQIQNGDTLIVTKLDRIARSTKDGLDIIDTLLSKGVNIEILNMGKFDNTPVGKLMRTVFFAFAEFERDMIVERTSEGKAIAKQKENYTEGRPKKELPDFEKILKKQKDGELTITAACQILGISRTQWYRIVS